MQAHISLTYLLKGLTIILQDNFKLADIENVSHPRLYSLTLQQITSVKLKKTTADSEQGCRLNFISKDGLG